MKLLAIPLLLAAFGAGCATHSPTAGEQMIEQAEGTESLGKQWNEGARMAAHAASEREHAQRKIDAAERDLPQAREELARAERDLATAQRMMSDAEAEYTRRFPGRSLRDAQQH
jgi:chromosome segregation ATPase